MRILLHLFCLIYTCSISAQPYVRSFTPVSGPIGTTVTINGNNFSSTPEKNIVFFGAVKATVLNASSNNLVVTVPIGATYHPITVTVDNLTAYSQKPFNVIFPACTASFASSFQKAIQPANVAGNTVKINDLDGDGKPDLSMSFTGSALFLLKNISSIGNINFSTAGMFGNVGIPFFHDVGDLDGDGKPDIVVGSGDGGAPGSISVLRNTSSAGTIRFNNPIYLISGASPFGIRIGDLDGDGKPDIAVVNAASNTISIFKNTSIPGTFSFMALAQIATGDTPYNIWIDDLDGDGKPDLVVPNLHSNTVSLYRNTSVAGFISFSPSIDLASVDGPDFASCGDLNGDGKDEIIVSDLRSGNVSVYENLSIPGNFSFPAPIEIATGSFPSTTCITDMNGDGKPDILITFIVEGKVSVVQNNSTGSNLAFSAPTNYITGFNANGIDAGDLDGDGKPDMAVPFNTLTSGSVITYRNIITTPPVLKVNTTQATCNKNNGTITASATGGTSPLQYSINGTTFQSSGNFTGLSANTYTITVKDSRSCTSATTDTVKQTGSPQLSATGFNASCMANDGSITVSASGGILPYTFSRDSITFQPGNVFNNLGSRAYTIVVKDSAGCTDDTSITIKNNCIVLSATTIADTCNRNTGQITATGSAGIPPYVYSINGSVFQQSNFFNMLSSGSYKVIVTDADNNKDSTQVTVSAFGTPVIANAGSDITICQAAKGQLNASTDGTSFTWAPANSLTDPFSLNPEAFPDNTTTYTFTATNGVCFSVDSVTAFVNPAPHAFAGNDTVSIINGQIQLLAKDLNNSGASSYTWIPSSGLNNPYVMNPVATLGNNRTYEVIIKTANGCSDTDNITITVFKGPEIYLPNAFTPNGDGINDVFKASPVGIKKFEIFVVYNRWGEMIFSTTDPKKGWHGTFKGIPQPTGTYMWVANGIANNGTIIKRKGIVTLLR